MLIKSYRSAWNLGGNSGIANWVMRQGTHRWNDAK